MSYADKSCGNLTDTDKKLFAAAVASSGGISSDEVTYKDCSEVVDTAASRLRGRRLADSSQSQSQSKTAKMLDIAANVRIPMAETSSSEESATLDYLAKQLQRRFADNIQLSLDSGQFLTTLSQAYANATSGAGNNTTGVANLFTVSAEFSVSDAVVDFPPTASPTPWPGEQSFPPTTAGLYSCPAGTYTSVAMDGATICVPW